MNCDAARRISVCVCVCMSSGRRKQIYFFIVISSMRLPQQYCAVPIHASNNTHPATSCTYIYIRRTTFGHRHKKYIHKYTYMFVWYFFIYCLVYLSFVVDVKFCLYCLHIAHYWLRWRWAERVRGCRGFRYIDKPRFFFSFTCVCET